MYKLFFKRFIDIICGLVGCIAFLIAFIFVAPIIHFTDKGPVFYNAERRGKGGKTFKMYKFRSMMVNAPDIRSEDGSTYNGENDPRVTKIGKIMRKTSIDELPQFINVLKGDMSMIGPRPKLPRTPLSEMSEERLRRYEVRPGITGYSQAYFRNSATADEKFKHDIYYIENLTFMMDVKILIQTAVSVLKRKNIYNAPDKETKKEEIVQ